MNKTNIKRWMRYYNRKNNKACSLLKGSANTGVFLLVLLLVTIYSCGLDNSEPTLVYRSEITVETNLDSLKISTMDGVSILTNSSIYPYSILDSYTASELSVMVGVSPVLDTGYIKFELYSAEAFDNPIPYLRDSLTFLTPVDTINIWFRSGAGYDTIIVNPKFK